MKNLIKVYFSMDQGIPIEQYLELICSIHLQKYKKPP